MRGVIGTGTKEPNEKNQTSRVKVKGRKLEIRGNLSRENISLGSLILMYPSFFKCRGLFQTNRNISKFCMSCFHIQI
jgi:hypothetical protein